MRAQDLFALFYGVFFASMLSSCFGLSLFQWGWICRSAHKTLRLIISIVLLNIFPAIYFAWIHKNLGGVSTSSFRSILSIFLLGLSVFGFYRFYHFLIACCMKCLYESKEIKGKDKDKRYEELRKRLAGIGFWPGQAGSVIFYFAMAYFAWHLGIDENGRHFNKPLFVGFLILLIGAVFKTANNEMVQNVFKIITGLAAILALVISLQTYKRSVVFGNRPLPKVQLDSAGEFFKISIANRGKDPLIKARLLFKFLRLEGDTPLEESAKTGKACAGLIEQEDPPAVFGTQIKVADFDLHGGRVFVFALSHSDSLYGEKVYSEMFYRNSAGEGWHRLNENYGALSDAHQDIARKQIQLLKNTIRQGNFDSFCQS